MFVQKYSMKLYLLSNLKNISGSILPKFVLKSNAEEKTKKKIGAMIYV